jgi:putative DNA primase/helicase
LFLEYVLTPTLGFRARESKRKISINLHPNNPKLFVTSRLPVEYDPEATCPSIEKFFKDILPGQDREITWLQEYIGYCLWRAWPYDKVVMLLGEGYNGKSTLIEIIRSLLGHKNTVSIGLYDLCHGRWYLAELYKKLANLNADIAPKDLKLTSKFKTATGGDTIQGERKYKDPFWYDSFCKHIMSCNTIPYCYDDSDAFYRRWLIIQFYEQFRENDPRTDPNILDKLTKELPARARARFLRLGRKK